MRPCLELRNVSKGYGTGRGRTDVLRDVNLSVERGEFVAVVGYSGAGKTTLMSMVAGLVKPDSGTITLDGKPITGPGTDRGVVFQNYSLLPWMTVFENVYLAVEQAFPDWTREERVRRAEEYVRLVNLAPARDKRPPQLSGGMRQRVSLARALAMDPRMLLMDEPLSALDALTRATLQDEIDRIWRTDRNTVLLITNDVDEGILLADRIVPLSAGPSATLGPSIPVPLERPRDRAATNHSPEFRRVRKEVFDWLLGPGRKGRGTSASAAPKPAPLPAIAPVHGPRMTGSTFPLRARSPELAAAVEEAS